MDEEYFTIDEVAKRFKVTRGAVYKWMRSGDLPFVYVGKDRRITGAALRAFVRPGNADDLREETSEDWFTLRPALA